MHSSRIQTLGEILVGIGGVVLILGLLSGHIDLGSLFIIAGGVGFLGLAARLRKSADPPE